MELGVSGLISGINSGDIVDALINADRGANRLLEGRKTRMEAKLEAVRSLNTRLLSAQIDVSALRRSATYSAKTASSSNENAVTVTAAPSAVAGAYTFEVMNTAKAHQMTTAAQASEAGNLGTGTITLQVGSGAVASIAITTANSGLNGIAQAINDAKAGVVASVVKENGNYRMILQGQKTGSAESISISAVDDNGADSIDLANLFTTTTTLTAADNARLKLGSGGSPIVIESATNTVTDFIPGVTLNLKGPSAGEMTVNVVADTTEAKEAISTFIESMNGAIDYLKANSSYDPLTKEGGILISETGLKSAMNGVMSTLLGFDPNLPSSRNTLTSIGVTLEQATGRLLIDDAKLNAALTADPEAVANIFRSTGTAAAPGVSFASLSGKTKAKNFAIDITQAPRQAVVNTVGNMADDGMGNVIITSSNNTLNLNVNGRTFTATLALGTFTRAQAAEQLQESINSLVPTGSQVKAGLNGTALDLRSGNYGSSQSLQITGGSANGVFNLSVAGAIGADVIGTIDGQAATGVGKILKGTDGTGAEGLTLVVSSATAMTTTMEVRKGMGQRLDEAMRRMTDAETGSITGKEDAIESSIGDMQERLDALDKRLEARRARYKAEFLVMETLIAGYRSQENFVLGQISGFENAARARSG